MKKIVIFTGAGVSAESGLKTFRDADGLWEEYPIEEVATPEAWHKNPDRVQEFYNQRRKQIQMASPNAAHLAIAKLEHFFEVSVITQNIDDLHERAGSIHVWHLHGNINFARSSLDSSLIYPVHGWKIEPDARCEKGSLLRPDVVWFGEEVQNLEISENLISEADIMIIAGTSLKVYPAAGLVYAASSNCEIYVVDREDIKQPVHQMATLVKGNAATVLPLLVEELLERLD